MTTQEFIKRQREKIAQLKSGKAVAIAAQDTHVKMAERIFEQGETSEGNKLKYNSSDPLYVNPKDAPRSFPPKGKTGKTKFENGKPHKTGYFESYKDYRQKIGRESGFMNLNLFGNLQSDFGKGVIKVDDSAYASTVTQESNKGKLEKFSTYFKLNKEERKNFRDVLEFETIEILKVL
jgi:hypothetical protein